MDRKPNIQQGVYNYEGEVVYLKDENLPPIEYFTLEEVELDNNAETFSYVYKDKMIIKCQRNTSPLVSVFDYNTHKEISHYFNRGNGPIDMLGPSAHIKDNNIYIYDFLQDRIASFIPDSILTQRSSYKPKISYIAFKTSSSFDFIDNNTILVYNDMYKEGFDVGENVPEFFVTDANSGKSTNSEFKTNGKYYPMNVTGGEIVKCPQSDLIYVAYQDEPRIKIMDKNLKTIKTLLGPEENDMEFVVEGFDFYHNREKSSYFYTSSCTTSNYCVFINDRAYKLDMYEARDVLTHSARQEIWVMNSNGDIVRRLKQKDTSAAKKMMYISYCEENDTFHVNAADEDDEFCLYKCVLEKLP
ncbi:MAG: hypothetical protein Q4C30_04595 [Bacteroidia bacterium]|nr:hypothetical protein [Bacteroidia bacterium]